MLSIQSSAKTRTSRPFIRLTGHPAYGPYRVARAPLLTLMRQVCPMRSAVAPRDKPDLPLTTREAALVRILIDAASDGRSLTRGEAGKLAGYSGNDETARVQASRALSKPKVRAALIDGIRDAAQVDVAAAYAVLRHVADRARSTRDRLGAASKHLDLAGLTGGPSLGMGAGVAVQIVFRSDAGALLVQSEQARPDAQAIRGVQAIDHGIAEGEDGGRQARPQISRAKATARQRKAPRGGGGGDFGERGKEEGGVPSRRPPEKSGGGKGGAAKISRVVKSRGGA